MHFFGLDLLQAGQQQSLQIFKSIFNSFQNFAKLAPDEVIRYQLAFHNFRWFEFRLSYNDQGDLYYWTTELMETPSYIRFSSYWDELVSTGFGPLIALTYFNTRIYTKIRASGKFDNRFVGRQSFRVQRYPYVNF